MDGDELLVELRRLPAYQDTPVVVFSSADTEIAAPLALGLGANEYVQKPSDIDAFFAAIRTMITTWLKPGDS
jgi:DNA-binding response OmpR family regulator